MERTRVVNLFWIKAERNKLVGVGLDGVHFHVGDCRQDNFKNTMPNLRKELQDNIALQVMIRGV